MANANHHSPFAKQQMSIALTHWLTLSFLFHIHVLHSSVSRDSDTRWPTCTVPCWLHLLPGPVDYMPLVVSSRVPMDSPFLECYLTAGGADLSNQGLLGYWRAAIPKECALIWLSRHHQKVPWPLKVISLSSQSSSFASSLTNSIQYCITCNMRS